MMDATKTMYLLLEEKKNTIQRYLQDHKRLCMGSTNVRFNIITLNYNFKPTCW